MGEKAVRAAVYARVSTLDQNPDLQIRELRAYADRRSWKITEFVDHGISGSETRRPRLAALNEALFRHEFDVVLVWKFDRIFRSVQHIVEFFEKCRRLRIEFVSVTEQIDTNTPMGKFFFHLSAAIAEFERELIRERVLAGLRAAKARGKKFGRPRKPVDTRKILEDQRAGRSYREIARDHGISSTTAFAICNGARSERRSKPR